MPSKDNEEDLKEDRGRTGRQEDLLCNSRGGKGVEMESNYPVRRPLGEQLEEHYYQWDEC